MFETVYIQIAFNIKMCGNEQDACRNGISQILILTLSQKLQN